MDLRARKNGNTILIFILKKTIFLWTKNNECQGEEHLASLIHWLLSRFKERNRHCRLSKFIYDYNGNEWELVQWNRCVMSIGTVGQSERPWDAWPGQQSREWCHGCWNVLRHVTGTCRQIITASLYKPKCTNEFKKYAMGRLLWLLKFFCTKLYQ